jgi:carboxylesterase type B
MPHPVMVYFHGGSNKIGSGNYFDGHVLAMLGVVVVVPNFRLGPVGKLQQLSKIVYCTSKQDN